MSLPGKPRPTAPAPVQAPAPAAPGTAARIGAVAWIVGAVQFLVVQAVAGAAWKTPFSWADHNISDLGNVHCGIWDTTRPRYVCSPLHDAMNVSFVAQGLLLLAGVLLTGPCWGRGGRARAARTLLVLAAGGYLLAGLAPADVDENTHLLGALLILGLGNTGLLLAGWLRRESLFGRGVRGVTLLPGALALVAVVLFFGQLDPGIGLGGMERVAVFPMQVWTVCAGVAVLRAAAGTAGETVTSDFR